MVPHLSPVGVTSSTHPWELYSKTRHPYHLALEKTITPHLSLVGDYFSPLGANRFTPSYSQPTSSLSISPYLLAHRLIGLIGVIYQVKGKVMS